MVYCAQVQETLTKVKRIFGDGRPFLFSQLQQLIQQASVPKPSPPSFTRVEYSEYPCVLCPRQHRPE
jgi:hypothetical protein